MKDERIPHALLLSKWKGVSRNSCVNFESPKFTDPAVCNSAPMAKSVVEECQAWLKHQLSGNRVKAALTAIIVHKNSGIYVHKELIEG
ncbi:Short Transient Receptor Potential Channel 6 [Manis pentadactyla]|nr:Short Transient Receptor Potential Channel 6 [Manis pentadactyla]